MMRYYIGFSRKNHLYARAIRRITKTEISHVYLRQIGPAADYVLEATHPKVDLQWGPTFEDGTTVVHEFEVLWDADELDRAWSETVARHLNRPYGWVTIIGEALVYLWCGLTGRMVSNPWPAPRQDVCSETVLAWLRRVGLPEFRDWERNMVAPSDQSSDQDGILEVVRRYPELYPERPTPPACDTMPE